MNARELEKRTQEKYELFVINRGIAEMLRSCYTGYKNNRYCFQLPPIEYHIYCDSFLDQYTDGSEIINGELCVKTLPPFLYDLEHKN